MSTTNARRGDSPLKSNTALKEGTLELPNELIHLVLEYLSPLDVLSAGRTCHHMREVVNDQAKRLTRLIVRRERTRMAAGLVMSGASLVGAIRSWILHHGPQAERSFHATALRIANNYVRANGIDVRDTGYRGDHLFFARLVEYLLHVNYMAGHRARDPEGEEGLDEYALVRLSPSTNVLKSVARCSLTSMESRTCLCLLCSPYREGICCWVETAVVDFRKTGWKNEVHPLAFWRDLSSPVTEILVSEEEWLDMVRSILAESLEDPTDKEKREMHNALVSQIRQGFGKMRRDIVKEFITLAELPKQRRGGEMKILIPGMDVSKKKHSLSLGSRQMACETLGVRAAKEFCLHLGRALKGEKKLLDPENRYLVAVMYEELRLVSGEFMLMDEYREGSFESFLG
ncbi:hypothetical protein M409DRAFT_54661 [Zasmidium cellare ATCC 36951]|uniref:F-box domain-containing protein n=1 Tax=Zasmidium cellare ATCC 36951 TaxID=1080233 RepID=A0A6A6CHZ9_ZASCE|nr:uncharacterized protein M409DRAFT_54661 [Zasmidium cellare ATCC 36951]KAF2166887.1 hypothetical protein M409DRAFT_54661 [Zasmidium cellare ATCC 36951]